MSTNRQKKLRTHMEELRKYTEESQQRLNTILGIMRENLDRQIAEQAQLASLKNSVILQTRDGYIEVYGADFMIRPVVAGGAEQ